MRKWLYGVAGIALLTAAACTPPADAPAEPENGAAEDVAGNGEADAAVHQDNPFFEASWDTPFGAPPFDRIREEHFVPAYERGMERHAAEIAAIADNPEPPTFENTIIAMELAGTDLDRVSRVFSTLNGSASNDAIRAIQREMSPRLARHNSAINLNEALFARIDDLYQRRDELGLDAEQARVLQVTHERFVRSGAQLEGEDRERYAEITARLSELYTQFGQNMLADEDAWRLVLTEDDLDGLGQGQIAAARQAARDRGVEDGYVITLSRSSVEPFLTFSSRRDLREQAWRAWILRGDNDDANDNKAVINQILELRLERSRMLGFPTYAHFRTAGTMAETPDAAMQLMEEVWWPARATALREADDIRARMAAQGADHELEPWDWRYYTEQVRTERYDISDDEVRPYLSLDNMIEAQFWVAGELFGLTFHERDDVPVYNPDVRVWEVRDRAGEHVGVFYGDYYARQGKRGGAWMTAFRVQNGLTGDAPLITNDANYNKPPEGEPALLTFTDANTLFHEFGHALHGLLSNTTHPSIAGTAVDRDYVEFPSQVLEHWLLTPEVLSRFARHYETGEPMPDALRERIIAARTFNEGFATVEYLASAFVDMAYHLHEDNPGTIDVRAFENEVLERWQMPDEIVMRWRSPHFGHSFSGEGYAAGYYSYLWASVLENDAVEAFHEAGGLYDLEVAESLRLNILSSGNSRTAMENYVAFRGREPRVEALLRNRGFLDDSE